MRALRMLLIFVIPLSVAGQGVQAEVSGEITDETGAAMPGASVLLTDVRTNLSFETVTTSEGTFAFAPSKADIALKLGSRFARHFNKAPELRCATKSETALIVSVHHSGLPALLGEHLDRSVHRYSLQEA